MFCLETLIKNVAFFSRPGLTALVTLVLVSAVILSVTYKVCAHPKHQRS